MRKKLFLLLLAFISICQMDAVERTKLNFNRGWLLKVGDRKYFIEFEGVRFGADIWLNGKKVGHFEGERLIYL